MPLMITTISFLFEKVFQKKLKFYPIAMVVLWQFKLKVHVSRFLTLVFFMTLFHLDPFSKNNIFKNY